MISCIYLECVLTAYYRFSICVHCRQVIEGTETLKAIEEEQTQNERPLREVRVKDCGVLKFEF